MKIVFCLNSIAEPGGIAVATITKANALAQIPGNEVTVCVSDHRDTTTGRRLGPDVKLICLDVNYYADDWKSKWHVLKGILVKRRIHKRKLKKVLEEISPDVVIAAGQCEKYFLPRIKGSWKSIREIHYTTDYRRLLARGAFGKIKAFLESLYDYKIGIRPYHRIALLTHEDKHNFWKSERKAVVIPNPVSFCSSNTALLESKKIVTIGRLQYQKNIGSLLEAFAKVHARHPDWQLEIYGEGPEEAALREYARNLGLSESVRFMGLTPDPEKALAGSSVFALTSRFEGFGLVLAEAMECGVPPVGYDCAAGPKDIIADGEDGFLVPQGDTDAMADRICRLIEDDGLRKKMGEASKLKAREFYPEKIAARWMELLREITDDA